MDAFDVLADETRRRIVQLLATDDMSAGDIADEFPISGPAVSRHLRVLRESGFVSVRRQAQQWIYRLDPEPLDAADEWIRSQLDVWRHRLDALGDHLDDMARVREADRRRKHRK